MPIRYPPDDPREWLNRARSNLVLARASGEGLYLEDLCFNLQQVKEQGLRGLRPSCCAVQVTDTVSEALKHLRPWNPTGALRKTAVGDEATLPLQSRLKSVVIHTVFSPRQCLGLAVFQGCSTIRFLGRIVQLLVSSS